MKNLLNGKEKFLWVFWDHKSAINHSLERFEQ